VNLSKLNPSARLYARALLQRFPRFRKNCTVEKGGNFEAFIWAPPTSNAGALICQSFRGDVWVRFAPGKTGCCVESTTEMLNVVRDLLRGKLVITVVESQKSWVDTTVRPARTKPVLKRGQTVAIYSWKSLPRRRTTVTRRLKRQGGASRRRLT
jgi:hypothetical protein